MKINLHFLLFVLLVNNYGLAQSNDCAMIDVNIQSDHPSYCLNDTIILTATSLPDTTYQAYWQIKYQGDILLEHESATNQYTLTTSNVGTYEVAYAMFSDSCSTDTISIALNIADLPQLSLDNIASQLSCVDATDSLMLAVSSDTSLVEWLWQGPSEFTSTMAEPVISPVETSNSGTYQVVVTDINGCQAVAEEIITITEELEEINIATDGRVCEGTDVTLYVPFIQGATYTWTGPQNFNATINNPVLANVNEASEGTYIVQASVNGCDSPYDTLQLNVLTQPVLEDDFVKTIIDSAITFSAVHNDKIDYSGGVITRLLAFPKYGAIKNLNDGRFTYTPDVGSVQEDQYSYEVCNVRCPSICDVANVYIQVTLPKSQCLVPSVITPNSDGKNDLLEITCLEDETNYPNNQLFIYNQWGALVFEAMPYNNNWDGTYNGDSLPDGTYYYIFKRDNSAEVEKGVITIYR